MLTCSLVFLSNSSLSQTIQRALYWNLCASTIYLQIYNDRIIVFPQLPTVHIIEELSTMIVDFPLHPMVKSLSPLHFIQGHNLCGSNMVGPHHTPTHVNPTHQTSCPCGSSTSHIHVAWVGPSSNLPIFLKF